MLTGGGGGARAEDVKKGEKGDSRKSSNFSEVPPPDKAGEAGRVKEGESTPKKRVMVEDGVEAALSALVWEAAKRKKVEQPGRGVTQRKSEWEEVARRHIGDILSLDVLPTLARLDSESGSLWSGRGVPLEGNQVLPWSMWGPCVMTMKEAVLGAERCILASSRAIAAGGSRWEEVKERMEGSTCVPFPRSWWWSLGLTDRERRMVGMGRYCHLGLTYRLDRLYNKDRVKYNAVMEELMLCGLGAGSDTSNRQQFERILKKVEKIKVDERCSPVYVTRDGRVMGTAKGEEAITLSMSWGTVGLVFGIIACPMIFMVGEWTMWFYVVMRTSSASRGGEGEQEKSEAWSEVGDGSDIRAELKEVDDWRKRKQKSSSNSAILDSTPTIVVSSTNTSVTTATSSNSNSGNSSSSSSTTKSSSSSSALKPNVAPPSTSADQGGGASGKPPGGEKEDTKKIAEQPQPLTQAGSRNREAFRAWVKTEAKRMDELGLSPIFLARALHRGVGLEADTWVKLYEIVEKVYQEYEEELKKEKVNRWWMRGARGWEMVYEKNKQRVMAIENISTALKERVEKRDEDATHLTIVKSILETLGIEDVAEEREHMAEEAVETRMRVDTEGDIDEL